MNTRGRLVAERLAYSEAILGEPATPDMANWFEAGYDALGELRDTMHGEIDPRTVDERPIRHWQKYGRGIEGVARGLGKPGIKRWLRDNPGGSPMTPEPTWAIDVHRRDTGAFVYGVTFTAPLDADPAVLAANACLAGAKLHGGAACDYIATRPLCMPDFDVH
jgi:hypothetical protein